MYMHTYADSLSRSPCMKFRFGFKQARGQRGKNALVWKTFTGEEVSRSVGTTGIPQESKRSFILADETLWNCWWCGCAWMCLLWVCVHAWDDVCSRGWNNTLENRFTNLCKDQEKGKWERERENIGAKRRKIMNRFFTRDLKHRPSVP